MPSFGSEQCEQWWVEFKDSPFEKGCLLHGRPCILVGKFLDPNQAFLKVVAPGVEEKEAEEQEEACPTLKQLCRGVVTPRSTYDAVRHAVNAGTPPESPTASTTSKAHTGSASPTSSSPTPTPTKTSPTPTSEDPSETSDPVPTKTVKPLPDKSNMVANPDPPLAKQ